MMPFYMMDTKHNNKQNHNKEQQDPLVPAIPAGCTHILKTKEVLIEASPVSKNKSPKGGVFRRIFAIVWFYTERGTTYS
jgi:hypothetical protein